MFRKLATVFAAVTATTLSIGIPDAHARHICSPDESPASCAHLDRSAGGSVFGDAEPVERIAEPNITQAPVFNASFGPEAGVPSLGSTTDHVAVAVGGDRLWAVDEGNSRVTAWTTDTRSPSGSFGLGSGFRPRGIAYYRGEVYVGNAAANNVQVFRPNGTSAPPSRVIGLPDALTLVDGTVSTVLGGELRLTGVDVAWQEVWVSFSAGDGGRVVLVFDSVSGAPKAAMFHVARYDCEVLTDRGFSGIDCEAAGGTEKDLVGACLVQPSEVPTLGDLTGRPVLPLTYRIDACKGQVTEDGALGGDVWDLATVPELGQVVSGCRLINRNAILTAASIDEVNVSREVMTRRFASETCSENRQDGVDAVWGMKWLLSAEHGSAASFADRRIVPAAETTPTTLTSALRRWSPRDTSAVHRDIAYHKRDARIDWSGELKRADHWQRGTRCLSYIVTDADIFVVGAGGEHWYELARGFQRIELLLGGTPISFTQNGVAMTSSTSPSGSMCVRLDDHQSGVRDLTLRAVVVDNKVVTSSNPRLHVDRDAPAATLSLPSELVGDVAVRGSVADPHSGLSSASVVALDSAGTTHLLCTPATSTFDCGWQTDLFPDGTYRVRVVSSDNSDPKNDGVTERVVQIVNDRDSDGDGVADIHDACPAEHGTGADGCPFDVGPRVEEKGTWDGTSDPPSEAPEDTDNDQPEPAPGTNELGGTSGPTTRSNDGINLDVAAMLEAPMDMRRRAEAGYLPTERDAGGPNGPLPECTSGGRGRTDTDQVFLFTTDFRGKGYDRNGDRYYAYHMHLRSRKSFWSNIARTRLRVTRRTPAGRISNDAYNDSNTRRARGAAHWKPYYAHTTFRVQPYSYVQYVGYTQFQRPYTYPDPRGGTARITGWHYRGKCAARL